MSPTRPLWMTILACLAGGALCLAPPNATEIVRTSVRDGLVPGQRAATWIVETGQSQVLSVLGQWVSPGSSPEIEPLKVQLAMKDQEARRWLLEAASLREQLDAERRRASAGLPVTESPPLYEADLVGIRVLGTELSGLWRARPMLDGGSAEGIRESSLVIDDARPVLDAGSDALLEPDQPVFAGGTVIGKILRVGQFSSTLLPVTDPEFLGAARLVRRSGEHVVYGAAGTLKGNGTNTCQLVRIPASEPVTVGDLVVTVDTDGLLPPQVYGEVVEADPPHGTLEWQIQVKPAASQSTTRVQVLRTRLNPQRISRRMEGASPLIVD